MLLQREGSHERGFSTLSLFRTDESFKVTDAIIFLIVNGTKIRKTGDKIKLFCPPNGLLMKCIAI